MPALCGAETQLWGRDTAETGGRVWRANLLRSDEHARPRELLAHQLAPAAAGRVRLRVCGSSPALLGAFRVRVCRESSAPSRQRPSACDGRAGGAGDEGGARRERLARRAQPRRGARRSHQRGGERGVALVQRLTQVEGGR